MPPERIYCARDIRMTWSDRTGLSTQHALSRDRLRLIRNRGHAPNGFSFAVRHVEVDCTVS